MISQPPAPELPTIVEKRATIDVESANVRAGPSTGASVVKSLKRGETVALLGSEGGWLRVRFGEGTNGVGWIFADLLGDTPPQDPQTSAPAQ